MEGSQNKFGLFNRLSLIGLGGLVVSDLWELGWPMSQDEYELAGLCMTVSLLVYVVGFIGEYLQRPSSADSSKKKKNHQVLVGEESSSSRGFCRIIWDGLKSFGRELADVSLWLLLVRIAACSLIFYLLYSEEGMPEDERSQAEMIRLAITTALVVIPMLVSLTHVFQWVIRQETRVKRASNKTPGFLGLRDGIPPAVQFILSMMLLILVGAGLLMLPNSTVDHVSFLDALFTSASAVTVTGLSTVNFAAAYTMTGKVFVMFLIQIGGLGVMTFAYFLAMIAGQGFSVKDRVLLQDILDADNIQGVVKMVRRIVICTFVVETLGALSLYFCWAEQGLKLGDEPLWFHSVFHSVSAFCNAGFSTFSDGLTTPEVRICRSGELVLLLLISCGGLGFTIFAETVHHLKVWSWHRLAFLRKIGIRYFYKQSLTVPRLLWTPLAKLVIYTTISLTVVGTIILFFLNNNQDPNVASMSWLDRLWICFFTSISARTAGFSLIELHYYLPAACLIICALMLIGGSPGGTAGGIKTTTVAVVAGEIYRILKGREEVHFFQRSIEQKVIGRCVATVVVCGVWVGVSTVMCCFFQPESQPLEVLFEVASSFSTCGLSMGITPELNSVTKSLLILNMIVGRTGLFMFLVAVSGKPSPRCYSYPPVRIPLT